MNTRHTHQVIFRTCTAVALPLVLMIGCSENEPAALERGAGNPTAGIVLEPDSATEVAMDRNGLRYLKVTTRAPVKPADGDTDELPVTPVLYFDTDKDAVAAEDLDRLKPHAEFLLAHARYMLHVNGHADERGTPAHNADLSARRARQTAAVLISLGVPESQLDVAGFGANVPAGDPHRWDKNRRVELLYSDDHVVSMR